MKKTENKTIGLVAHDTQKIDIVDWCIKNNKYLKDYTLVGTEGTSKKINQITSLRVKDIGHGPDGGDVHIAYNILGDKIDALIFFIDTKTAHGHEHDIQTLIRTCTTKNIPLALNKSTANCIIKSL